MLTLLVIAFVFLIAGVWLIRRTLTANCSAPFKRQVVFVERGASLPQIEKTLTENHVLCPGDGRLFYWLTRSLNRHRDLKPGEYEFDSPVSAWQAMHLLVNGKTVLHRVTVPEGYTVKEIRSTLAVQGLIDPEVFQEQLEKEKTLQEFGLPGPTFEGYLFPDTYYFSKLDGEKKILETMVKRFKEALSEKDRARAKDLGFSLRDWVTLASIIEKESTHPDEQVLVSSVFHNRLRKGMRLQSDPTVIYGVKDFDGNLTRKHLETPTDYNTYTKKGLPPGPIANPGASALHAALYPVESDYFYFVGDRKGRHVFSKTYEEHLRNVAHYQLRRR